MSTYQGGTLIVRKNILSAVLISSLFLTGCVFGPSAEEEISKVLDATVEQEQGFVESQEPIKALEQEEKEIFNTIMGLSMEEFDQIKALAEEAMANLEQREEYLVAESDSIEEAQNEFNAIKDYVEDIDDEALRSHVEEMIQLMNQRYELHNELIVKYKEAIELDRELYTLLQDEELAIEGLEAQIEKVNAQYDETIKLNEEFNNITDQYNELKSEFYTMAGISDEE